MSLNSMTEIAFQFMIELNGPISFVELWQQVKETSGFTESQAANKIGPFYSAIMLDKRFVSLPDNIWDLRKRHTYYESHIDLSSLEVSEELIDDEDFDRELELEYQDQND